MWNEMYGRQYLRMPLRWLPPVLAQLFATHIDKLERQISTRLARIKPQMAALQQEITFLSGAIRLVQDAGNVGAALVWPRIVPFEQGQAASGLIYPRLLARTGCTIVPNDLRVAARSFGVIGGRNGGGKTTFLRAAAALQWMFQMGLPVFAEDAALAPVRAFASVFEHVDEAGGSAFVEDIRQLNQVLARADERMLVWLNEPFSSMPTQHAAQMIRRALLLLLAKGAQGLCVTHFYEVFDDLAGANALGLGTLEPLRTEADPYRIRPGMPSGLSQALDVYEQADALS